MRRRTQQTKEQKPSALAGGKERNAGSNATGASSPSGEQESWEPWGNSSAYNGRGAWWNSGASHMNEAYPVKYFRGLGLVELQMSKL